MRTTFTLALLSLLSSAANPAYAAEPSPSPYFATEPVQLLAFEGRGMDEGIVLYWETATEWQSEAYVVERSNDGTDWRPVGTLAAAGNHVGQRRYVFVDDTPYAGMNFYRLVQRDYLGEARVSDYLDVEYHGDYDPAVFPNPARSGQPINLRFWGFENQELQAELIDMDGRRRLRQSYDLTEGPNQLDLELPDVRDGIYFVRVFVDDFPVTTYRLLVLDR